MPVRACPTSLGVERARTYLSAKAGQCVPQLICMACTQLRQSGLFRPFTAGAWNLFKKIMIYISVCRHSHFTGWLQHQNVAQRQLAKRSTRQSANESASFKNAPTRLGDYIIELLSAATNLRAWNFTFPHVAAWEQGNTQVWHDMRRSFMSDCSQAIKHISNAWSCLLCVRCTPKIDGYFRTAAHSLIHLRTSLIALIFLAILMRVGSQITIFLLCLCIQTRSALVETHRMKSILMSWMFSYWRIIVFELKRMHYLMRKILFAINFH